jgi:hypothetical protein
MSDHIPDPTKMISDTPRTEAEVNRPHGPLDDIVTIDADFACQLERELNEANDRIKRMEEAGDALSLAAYFIGWNISVEKWNKAKEAKP